MMEDILKDIWNTFKYLLVYHVHIPQQIHTHIYPWMKVPGKDSLGISYLPHVSAIRSWLHIHHSTRMHGEAFLNTMMGLDKYLLNE